MHKPNVFTSSIEAVLYAKQYNHHSDDAARSLVSCPQLRLNTTLQVA